ncbi:MAG: diphosphomevalonate decarboxylase [Candidatus Diapherotrites archaeon]|nr:diphosphomevalonate decarboxylase [Candidatus Diapherotrites archaeon]
MKGSSQANANIALSKYWGKRDDALFLPQNGSVSVTLDSLVTTTTVEFDKKYSEDSFILNGNPGNEKEVKYTIRQLDIVRKLAGINLKAKVVSENNFPTAAGFASSASGFAALAKACDVALNLNLNEKELSIIARQGSGSASRSISGGFVEWLRGEKEDGTDSYGRQIANEKHWDIAIIDAVTASGEKKVKSRAGMAQTLKTCPYYAGWLKTVNTDIETIKKAILEKDFILMGTTAEANCLKMHALMMTTLPSIVYWNAGTMSLINSVMAWREDGLESYFTIDAGPNVKVICQEKDVNELNKRLQENSFVEKTLITRPGPGARKFDGDLF